MNGTLIWTWSQAWASILSIAKQTCSDIPRLFSLSFRGTRLHLSFRGTRLHLSARGTHLHLSLSFRSDDEFATKYLLPFSFEGLLPSYSASLKLPDLIYIPWNLQLDYVSEGQ